MVLKIFRVFIISVLFAYIATIPINTVSAAKTKKNILGKRKPKTDSERAILGIEKIVVSFASENQNITGSNIQNSIITQVESSYPLDTSGKPEKLNISEIEKKADLAAREKYPFTLEELKKKYTLEAEKKFGQAKINSILTVEFQQGAYIHKVTGRYRGFTFRGDGIRIGRTVIPLIDLRPNEKIRFNKKVRLLKMKDYINKSITNDLAIKEDFALKHIAALIDSIKKKNQEIGYIYAWHKWRTPKEVAKIIIKHYSNRSAPVKPSGTGNQ
jgi:hypothetical protein